MIQDDINGQHLPLQQALIESACDAFASEQDVIAARTAATEARIAYQLAQQQVSAELFEGLWCDVGTLERLNWLGDTSAAGMQRSAGLMVNYLYRLDDIEKNHEAYANDGEVVASSFDMPAKRHVEVAEMTLERARRLAPKTHGVFQRAAMDVGVAAQECIPRIKGTPAKNELSSSGSIRNPEQALRTAGGTPSAGSSRRCRGTRGPRPSQLRPVHQ